MPSMRKLVSPRFRTSGHGPQHKFASSVEGYQQYLTAEPNGLHVQVARDEIATRDRDAAWQTVQTNATAQSLRDFIINTLRVPKRMKLAKNSRR